MKILLAGDTHGHSPHVRYLLGVAADHGCARVVQLGDFGYWEHEISGVRFLDAVEKAAARAGVDLDFLDGNHDKSSLILERYHAVDAEGRIIVRPHVRYLPRGLRFSLGGRSFLALGGARSTDRDWRLAQEADRTLKAARKEAYRRAAGRPTKDPSAAGTLWFPEEELTDQDLDLAIADRSPLDVLLTHDKPRSSRPEWNRKNLPESHANQDRIDFVAGRLRPSLLVHGHLHFRYQAEITCGGAITRVVGLGCDPEAGRDVPGWRAEDSWAVLDLDDLTLT